MEGWKDGRRYRKKDVKDGWMEMEEEEDESWAVPENKKKNSCIAGEGMG